MPLNVDTLRYSGIVILSIGKIMEWTASSIRYAIIKILKNGSIILCHNGAKYTADALDTLITNLKKGYTFVPLSQLIIKENYHMEVDGTQVADI